MRFFYRLLNKRAAVDLRGCRMVNYSRLERYVRRRKKSKVSTSHISYFITENTASTLRGTFKSSRNDTPYPVQLLEMELNSGLIVSSLGAILGCNRLLVDPHHTGCGLIKSEAKSRTLDVASPHPVFELTYTATAIIALGPMTIKHPEKTITLKPGDAFIYKATSCKKFAPSIFMDYPDTAAVVHHYYSKPKSPHKQTFLPDPKRVAP